MREGGKKKKGNESTVIKVKRDVQRTEGFPQFQLGGNDAAKEENDVHLLQVLDFCAR